jgi:hypothetical protein
MDYLVGYSNFQLGFIVRLYLTDGYTVNYPCLNGVDFSLPLPNLLILLWISRSSASVRVCSRPDARMFLAALTSLSIMSPHLLHIWTLSDRGF